MPPPANRPAPEATYEDLEQYIPHPAEIGINEPLKEISVDDKSDHPQPDQPAIFRLPKTRPIADPQNGSDELTEFSAWWHEDVEQSLFTARTSTRITLDELIPLALEHSKQIRVAKLEPLIEFEQVTQIDANFDWTLFTQKMWIDTDQQTASQLDAGQGSNRLLQEDLTTDYGLRRKNRLGGQFEVSQNLRLHSSNSEFFDPTDQGLSRLTLRYNQPLLQNGGQLVNRGQVIIAQLQAEATDAASRARIQDVLLQVVQAYWDIYRGRAEYAIQKRLIGSTRDLLRELKRRRKIDAQKSLVAQVESQLATQLAEAGVSRVSVINAQNRLIRIVGDRSLTEFDELIPTEPPASIDLKFDSAEAFSVALQNRDEIRAAMRRIQSSELTRDIADRQLLPQLALILESNVAAINEDFDVFRSLGDQFSQQGPTYSVGLQFEVPLGNRRARSRSRQARLALQTQLAQFDDEVDRIRQEVFNAVVSLSGLSNQTGPRREAIRHAVVEAATLRKRRLLFPEEFDQISQLYIREYLDALQLRATAERAFSNAEVDHALGVIQLRRAMGALLNDQPTSATILCKD